jgi:hypothetical protein
MDSHSSDGAYLEQFDPFRDTSDWVSEGPYEYAARMQRTLLPDWPTEVLIHWLHVMPGTFMTTPS